MCVKMRWVHDYSDPKGAPFEKYSKNVDYSAASLDFVLFSDFGSLCAQCRVSCGSPKYPAHNDMRRMNSICIKCRISCGGEMTKNP